MNASLVDTQAPSHTDVRGLRQVIDSAVDYAIVVMDLDGLVTLWANGAAKTLGWDEAEMVGKPAALFFTEEDRQSGIPQSEMRNALRDGRANDERWHCRKDGTRFWAEGEMMPLLNDDGVAYGLVKVLRDRTKRRLDNEAQRQSAEFMRSVLAASDDCIKVLDLDAKLMFMSERGQRVMEVSNFDAIKGCPWPDFWRGAGNAAALAAIDTARAGGTGRFQGMADTMAGTARFWDVQVTPILGSDGCPQKLLSVSRDVTEAQDVRKALRNSETHWRNLFHNLHEGFIVGELVRDKDGRVLDWRYVDVNAAWGELVGIVPEMAVGRTIREMFADIEEEWITEMARVVEARVDAAFTRQVGSLKRWFEGRAFALEGDRFAMLFFEVTNRMKADARRLALLDLDDRIRDLDGLATMSGVASEIVGLTLAVQVAGYGTMDADDETLVIDVDWIAPGAVSVTGRHRLDRYGTFASDLKRGRDFVLVDNRSDSRTADCQNQWDTIPARAAVNIPLVENERLVAIFFILDDQPREWPQEDLDFVRTVAERLRSAIERRRAENELRDLAASLEDQVAERTRALDTSFARQRALFDVTRQLMGLMSLDGVLLDANNAALEAIGERLDNVVGKPFWQTPWFTGTPGMESVIKGALQSARNGVPARTEMSLTMPDETVRIYDFAMSPVRNAGGEVIEIMPEATDITDLRSIEGALRQSQKMEAVGQLTGGLAHDFNNLLAGISGSLELMQTRIDQGRLKDVSRYISAAQGATARAAALTHRLLAFSRRQTLDPKPTNVNKLVNGMEDLIRRTVGPAIAIEVVGSAGLWSVLVDPPQLENALLNLCINARDAMPDGGRITIETHNKWLDDHAAKERDMKPGQYLSLCVSDTGSGMAPHVIAKAFDPFFTTKPIGEGTGLGLSMIYGFAKQSGGQVRIYSEVGQGSNVCIYLPRHYEEEVEDTFQPDLKEESRANQGETVLVVDDESTIRMLVAEVLEDLGYTAIEASDSVGGLKVLQSDARIDLLVTDVGLPGGMNGRQMADAGVSIRPDLKVLFITGYAENAVLNNGHLKPGMQVLTKPFGMEALTSKIKFLLERER